MIIDCAVYRDGARVKTVPQDASGSDLSRTVAALADDEFIWIGISDPNPPELETIGEALGLHPLAVEDMLEPHQRPKVERYRDYVLVSLRAVEYQDDDVTTSEVNVCVSEKFVVTVRRGAGSIGHARARLEADPERLSHGTVAALHAVLDLLVDGYDRVAAELENDVVEVEESVFSEDRTKDSPRIYRLKRETLEFRRAVAPLKDPIARLSEVVIPESARPYIRDVADHLSRAMETIETIDSLLDNALAAHLAQLSVRQNEDMRKLTAGATLFAVPTAIAGIYGMNFRFMPELDWHLGYPLVLAVMGGLCGYIYYRFKRSGWL
ncbi:magnesium and cobalt transport protein CorA [Aeromicrobium phragmitis]|uniref:Magnesium transport protein CorA n=1 Tax=Aeromicrobium phragmitis TaxID=2478914 RepID=A0A3L8PK86_9ACTN|nr:magnesium/cobalt transporter CorA [Aeromicrobium phragmitis]RLV55604.1 magnesium and cobalt transport protein CorA [Aeromicrobium phragmitis]